MKLRIRFAKRGFSQFLGHLDVMRYFQKLIRRAGIDICYTAGFSPHQVMSFANPLGLGQTSEGEYMDIEVNSLNAQTGGQLIAQLNRFASEGIVCLECRRLPDNAQNAMASVAAARYLVTARENVSADVASGFSYIFDYPEKIRAFFAQDEILVMKKTKKSEAQIDIRPMIYDWRFLENERALSLFVSAGSAANLKPELVLCALHEAAGLPYHSMQYLIHREDMYMAEEDVGVEKTPEEPSDAVLAESESDSEFAQQQQKQLLPPPRKFQSLMEAGERIGE